MKETPGERLLRRSLTGLCIECGISDERCRKPDPITGLPALMCASCETVSTKVAARRERRRRAAGPTPKEVRAEGVLILNRLLGEELP